MARAATRQLNVRVQAEVIKDLEEIAHEEDLDKGAVTRRLLMDGIRRWRIERAVTLYREDRITKERAAEMARVSLYEMMDLLRERHVPAHLDVDEAVEEVKALVRRYAESPMSGRPGGSIRSNP
jgi:predicted HTH domain antitoxin